MTRERPEPVVRRLDPKRLRSASDRHAIEVFFRRLDSAVAVSRIRSDAPGWTTAEYGVALDTALAALESEDAIILRERAARIADARAGDMLDGVFALMFAERRSFGRQDALPPIDVFEVFEEVHSRSSIEDAIARSNALIADGMTFDGGGSTPEIEPGWLAFGSLEPRIPAELEDEMRRRHPGFSDRSISDSIHFGFFTNR